MRAVLLVLDALIRGLELAVNIIYQTLDNLIEVIDRMARRIASLIYNGLRLLFYVFPFLSMIVIGDWEKLNWVWYIGIAFIALVIILFIRELLSQWLGSDRSIEIDYAQRQRVFVLVLILNVATLGYFLLKFQNEIRMIWIHLLPK
jgi:hypothetical protein